MSAPTMQVFICEDLTNAYANHPGLYDEDGIAVILAEDEAHARAMLDAQIAALGWIVTAERPYTLDALAEEAIGFVARARAELVGAPLERVAHA